MNKLGSERHVTRYLDNVPCSLGRRQTERTGQKDRMKLLERELELRFEFEDKEDYANLEKFKRKKTLRRSK